jgi:tetratricopeptide (TPR) repeat protein
MIILTICAPLYVPAQGSTDALALFRDSFTLYKSQKYDESLQKLKQVIEIDPNFADAYILMGSILYTQEKYNESLIPLKKAIDLYENGIPSFASKYNGAYEDKGDAYFWYANSLFMQEKYNESSDLYSKTNNAWEDYLRALNKEPVVIRAHNFGGETMIEVIYPDGRVAPMDEHFKDLINATKSNVQNDLSEGYYFKGYSLYLMGSSNESLQYYNKAKAINQTWTPYFH